MNHRPLFITIVAWLFIGVGGVSMVSHAWRFAGDMAKSTSEEESRRFILDVSVATVSSVAAIIGGAFLLRARNWARWLCSAWLAAHVILSLYHPISELIVHVVFFVGITSLLFLPRAAPYFRAGEV